jgi:hypothetical protein
MDEKMITISEKELKALFKEAFNREGRNTTPSGDINAGFERWLDSKLEPFMNEQESNDGERYIIPPFTEFRRMQSSEIEYLTESENTEVDRWVDIFENEHESELDESFLGKLVGGVAGFLVGPTVGKIIARTLGVEKGVLYDMFTSRIVSAALGVALAKHFGGEYKN